MARLREAARRVFSIEYNRSAHEDKALEENAPNYVVTPLGESVNRLYFVGVLMSKVNNGTEESPLYRAEVRDPTGTFYLYVGQFQPQAMAALSSIEPPALLGVVGKVRTFVKEDGSFYASVKPETLFPVDIPQRDRWIVSAAKGTLDRADALKDAMEEEEPTVEGLMKKGHSRKAAEAAVNSIGIYGNVDVTPIREGVKSALKLVLEGGGRPVGIETAPAAPAPPPSKDNGNDVKEAILQIIREISTEKGALYRDMISSCEKKGIDRIVLEEAVQELLDEGQIYEPTIGIIKVI